jgi:3-phosphoshikimate 1-carboxyvinyltransferase
MSHQAIEYHQSYLMSCGGQVQGTIRVPGDKSISHRSIMLGAIAQGVTRITGFLEGEDALATMNIFRSLGVTIDGPEQGCVTVHGVGMQGLQFTQQPLDCGNSGTTMRLLSGLLSGAFSGRAAIDTIATPLALIGDASLSKRPMKRVIEPLLQMGAQLVAQDGKPPMQLYPVAHVLAGMTYTLPMASAQVKSAILLAGLFATGQTTVVEPEVTRDHTERMLRAFGVTVQVDGSARSIVGGQILSAPEQGIDVPADISSAAFFMVAASITPNADITLQHVGVNPTRIGIIQMLQRMGANITLLNPREAGGEPVADIRVQYAPLHGAEIGADLVALGIDELPVLFVAAACAVGQTVITGAEELRVKESDRIAVMAEGLQTIGAMVTPTADGMMIAGQASVHQQPCFERGGEVLVYGDHRIAMSFAVASLRASQSIVIHGTEHVATSFPNFVELAQRVGMRLTVQQSGA